MRGFHGVTTSDDLCEHLAADLDGAFPDLVRLHQDAVFGTALRCTQSWHDAEEIAQEAFVRAHRSLRGWDAERIRQLRPRAWLCTIAVNLVRNRVRDDGRRPQPAELHEGMDPVTARRDGPEAFAERSDDRRRLAAALATLPASHRQAIVLRHVGGLGYAEIAEALDAPVGTVKAQVSRGLRTLAGVLAGQGFEYQEVG